MRTEWIVCDLGKVLVDFDHASINRRLRGLVAAKQPGAAPPSDDALARFFFAAPRRGGRSFNSLLDRGEATLDEAAAAFRDEFGLELATADLRAVWSAIFRDTDPAMIRMLVDARAAGARLALCSNTNEPHWDFIVRNYPELDLGWDALFLSFRMGLSKTDAGFFERVAAETGAPPESHCFIDDLAENVDAARRAGMGTILFRGKAPGPEELGLVRGA